VKHLLVTNDFPPKVGGIQSYLWELWRRLPADDVVVFTTPYRGAAEWDRRQSFPVVRSREPVLLPRPGLAGAVDRLASDVGADFVLLDPSLPLGLIGPRLSHPYGVILHGAEVTVPGRLPGTRQLLARVVGRAEIVVAAGGYPADEARRAARRDLPVVSVPPGVDAARFRALERSARAAARIEFGLPADRPLVVSVSRLVPRKGFDTLIRAADALHANGVRAVVVIAGAGRDRRRLERIASRGQADVRFLGRVADEALPRLYGCADVFVMCCRSRWGGLEQEGFGIVFVEAAATAVPQIAGASGGAAEAVEDGVTGYVVTHPGDPHALASALARLLADPSRGAVMGAASRERVLRQFTYDALAARLGAALDALASS
jgi:phosphatidylinositol alpha-1,6-mannosyltransferase